MSAPTSRWRPKRLPRLQPRARSRPSPERLTDCRGGSRQPLVDEPDDGRSLADRGGAALDRSCADVARGVDAGNIGFELALGSRVGTGEHEAVLVARDGIAQPLRAGLRTQE